MRIGKTTLVNNIKINFSNLNIVILSLDDFYLTYQDQLKLASLHCNNPLLKFRGNPGTHDLNLLVNTIQACLNPEESIVQIPVYQKSLNNGRGDRLPIHQWDVVKTPIDLILCEGWCLGFKSIQDQKNFETVVNSLHFSLNDLTKLNNNLKLYEDLLYKYFEKFILISSSSLDYIYQWRLQQELEGNLKKNSSGLSKEEVFDFVDRFMPMYKLYLPNLKNHGFFFNPNTALINPDQKFNQLNVFVDKDRNLIDFNII
ncbi:hypothetical protein HDU92_006295 [Lobulomyces angularis]|nr:hypothetical protein HDU92_006295 [Lobulomyces angularis]